MIKTLILTGIVPLLITMPALASCNICQEVAAELYIAQTYIDNLTQEDINDIVERCENQNWGRI